MNILAASIKREPSFEPLMDSLCKEKRPVLAGGLCESASHVLCGTVINDLKSRKQDHKTLIIMPDENKARELCDRLSGFSLRAFLFPVRDYRIVSTDVSGREFSNERLAVLSRMLDGDFDVVVTTIEAACQQTIPRMRLKEATLTIDENERVSMDSIVKKLEDLGYKRYERVEGVGQYSVRGGIVDIFAPSYAFPVRVELFGDEIDSMSYFDILTQRRTEKVKKIVVMPSNEIFFGAKEREKIGSLLREQLALTKKNEVKRKQFIKDELLKLENGDELANDLYIGSVYPTENLFDYATELFYIVYEPDTLSNVLKGAMELLHENLRILIEEERIFAPERADGLLWGFDIFCDLVSNGRGLVIESFVTGKTPVKLAGIYNFNSRTTFPYGDSFELLKDTLKEYTESGFKTLLLCDNTFSAQNMYNILTENNIRSAVCDASDDISALPRDIVYVTASMKQDKRVMTIGSGYELVATKFVILTDSSVSVRRTTKLTSVYSSKKKNSAREKIISYADLNINDYVVHDTFGIGIYKGTEKIMRDGAEKDFLKIAYAGTDVLYVPCSNVDSIAKYIGGDADSGNVKLSKMGGGEWRKAKQKAKSAAKDIAKDLIKLYSERMKTKGHAFSEDTEWQKEFEGAFEYEETDGQLSAVEDIKRDMESPVPMDRLLCGDVGFGKTEVALRAVFKCVMDNKQAAILVPTTILAWQHYQNILSRFRGYPIRVAMLSRFATPKEARQTVKDLKSGIVDIIVGTHRILSKDVEIPKLGLVVIDEEQRFGVAQKEKLKALQKNADILTLTATPIPRTLNMALGGIRDMSVLEEAPGDRFPVQTYVMEYDEILIMEAIRKELRRRGQVFYLCNNIEEHLPRVNKIKEMFPDANVESANGQMDKEVLSDIWKNMSDGKIDVLVCTTIIETGVDLPNANTLIIENCDKYGLSQLHQIRGRIGRSDRKAYAFLTYRRGSVLSDIASKRLSAIREYTEFGSGFKLAMRDLEIRGAGNLLGAQQHGHMNNVGYEMYMRLLNEAVAEEKGQTVKSKTSSVIDLTLDAFIPEKYIESSKMRIDIYKKIASCENEDDYNDLMDEIIDRFGDPPKTVCALFDVARLKNKAEKCGITKVSQNGANMIYFISEDFDRETLVPLFELYGRRMRTPKSFDDAKPSFSVEFSLDKQSALSSADEILTHIIGFMKPRADGSGEVE
ncbi:MAG: transcription-repair coupling factor [Ruminococcaceae bacterium]|nr:transcription-repair coupling factor [Oscillospiraceae bacterium]